MQPKISGVLNNCAIHLVVPTIMNQLEEIYLKNQNGPFDAAYTEILETVKSYYDLEDTPSLVVVKSLLKLNATEQQYIMGLAIRQKKFQHELKDTGRFPELELDAAWVALHQELGITVQAFTDDQKGSFRLAGEYTCDNALATLRVYHKDGHFELESSPVEETVTGAFLNFASQCGEGLKESTEEAIAALKAHVKNTFDDAPELTIEENAKIEALSPTESYKGMLKALVRYQAQLLHPVEKIEQKANSEAVVADSDEALAKALQIKEDEELAKALQLEELEQAGLRRR